MIKIEDLKVEVGNFSLKSINMEIKDGEYFVILGPTGAGKTLLLETIAGFYKAEGRIYMNGSNITDTPPFERKIGFIYQDYMLFPNMSVEDNIAYGLKIKGMDDEEIKGKVDELAKMLGISSILHRYPNKLSGGEKQRVAIARALAINPEILLLDEPLASLDEMIKSRIMKELKNINRKLRITFIHVTHSREEAIMLADRIAVMNNGEILQIGEPKDIFRKPKTKFVAEFVGVENIFKGVAMPSNNLTNFISNGIKLISSIPMEGECYASIRPEDIIISKQEIKSSARNCLKGIIKEMNDIGKVVRISVDCGIPFIVNITHEALEDMELKEGDEVYLIFKAQKLNLFR